MASQIFVNLPVKDLQVSNRFYTALGCSINPMFSDEKATCIVISESHIYVMLLTEAFFQTFTPRAIADTQKVTQVLNCLDAESKEEVDRLVNIALENGGSLYAEAKDYGFMYQHSFADPDGHQWEIMYMDINQFPQQ